MSRKQRNSYISKFLSSQEVNKVGDDNLSNPQTPYPLLTCVDSKKVQLIPLAAKGKKTFSVNWIHKESDCFDYIVKSIESGKNIAWIRNTVDDAIDSYRYLTEKIGLPADSVFLFHSRFAMVDRQKVECKILDIFGKEGSPERRGKVLIATQVVEQSVDIDMDEMITDLAPIDLLIQRAGRLHRHIRSTEGKLKIEGQDERGNAVLNVFAPEWDENPSEEWYSMTFPRGSYVYPRHAILWLTQKILRRMGSIEFPEHARELIEGVYGDVKQIPKNLEDSEVQQLGKVFSDRNAAHQQTLNIPAGYGQMSNTYFDGHPPTRIGEETVTVYLAKENQGDLVPYASGEFGWELSRINVRKKWWQKNREGLPCVEGDCLSQWLRKNRIADDNVELVLLNEKHQFYSEKYGLLGI